MYHHNNGDNLHRCTDWGREKQTRNSMGETQIYAKKRPGGMTFSRLFGEEAHIKRYIFIYINKYTGVFTCVKKIWKGDQDRFCG